MSRHSQVADTTSHAAGSPDSSPDNEAVTAGRTSAGTAARTVPTRAPGARTSGDVAGAPFGGRVREQVSGLRFAFPRRDGAAPKKRKSAVHSKMGHTEGTGAQLRPVNHCSSRQCTPLTCGFTSSYARTNGRALSLMFPGKRCRTVRRMHRTQSFRAGYAAALP